MKITDAAIAVSNSPLRRVGTMESNGQYPPLLQRRTAVVAPPSERS